jgi:hypothetical protein
VIRTLQLKVKLVAAVVVMGTLASCSGAPTTPGLPTSIVPTSLLTTQAAEEPFTCKAGVVEQSFERGFMFWVGHTTQERCLEQHTYALGSGEVWVAILDEKGKQGQWLIFVDDWQAGIDPETDPSLTPPSADVSQPVRGFGKIWRLKLTEEQRNAIGWATGTELPFTSDYTYESASFKNDQGEVVPRPGKHSLRGLAGDLFVFDENARTVAHSKK